MTENTTGETKRFGQWSVEVTTAFVEVPEELEEAYWAAVEFLGSVICGVDAEQPTTPNLPEMAEIGEVETDKEAVACFIQ